MSRDDRGGHRISARGEGGRGEIFRNKIFSGIRITYKEKVSKLKKKGKKLKKRNKTQEKRNKTQDKRNKTQEKRNKAQEKMYKTHKLQAQGVSYPLALAPPPCDSPCQGSLIHFL